MRLVYLYKSNLPIMYAVLLPVEGLMGMTE